MEKILSATTANNLFWLGRYAERGYLILHLMRRAYDEVIDVPVGVKPYSEFLTKINGYVSEEFTDSYQMMQQIYDENNITSLRSIVERMMDNAIVLRPEIYSESFSYVELCRDKLKTEAEKGEMNITDLQPVTDWLLAFWGSISERVHGRAFCLLQVGRIIERMDIYLRFDYKHYRIAESWESLMKYLTLDNEVFDKLLVNRLDKMLQGEYDKQDVLALLNCLVRV